MLYLRFGSGSGKVVTWFRQLTTTQIAKERKHIDVDPCSSKAPDQNATKFMNYLRLMS